MTWDERQKLLSMPDDELMRECRVDTFRGTGKGGQKRNTTNSAVRVTHIKTALQASSDKTRSQRSNRGVALQLLRQEIALQCRCTPPAKWSGQWMPNPKNPRYGLWISVVLDVLQANGFAIKESAKYFGLSTNRFSKDLANHPQLWQAVNQNRAKLGLKLLT